MVNYRAEALVWYPTPIEVGAFHECVECVGQAVGP